MEFVWNVIKMKTIPKLTELIKTIGPDIGYGDGLVLFSGANSFGIFEALNNRGIKEVEVQNAEMSLIVRVFLANCSGGRETVKIMREGSVDKFLGVKLRLKNA